MGSLPSKNHQLSRKTLANAPKYDLNNLAVITVLFNPIKYKSRYELYHKFDEHMSRSGVTLLTVECIFKSSEALGLPLQKFEVTRANDPRHLQITAPSVLWLKENLINIAAKRLPDDIEYIAWLDADIEFERLDWPHLALHQLQHYPIVQLFELSSFLGPKGKKQVLRQDYSFAYAVRHEQELDPRRASECYVHPGYAWAMRRTAFEAMHGLLEISVLGSADIHFAYALINRIEETIPAEMHEDYRSLAKLWGERVAQVSHNGSRVGYLPVNIWHHWHGNRVNRGYFQRWSILERAQFSPLKDLERNEKLGLVRLAHSTFLQSTESARRLAEFEKSIIAYFRSRNEDSIRKAIPAIGTVVQTDKSSISSSVAVPFAYPEPDYDSSPKIVNLKRTYTDQSDDVDLKLPKLDDLAKDNRSVPIDLQNQGTSRKPNDDATFDPTQVDDRYREFRNSYLPLDDELFF